MPLASAPIAISQTAGGLPASRSLSNARRRSLPRAKIGLGLAAGAVAEGAGGDG